MIVDLPRYVLDSKKTDNVDQPFLVSQDGQYTHYNEIKTNDTQVRTLAIPFDNGTREIKIVGTPTVPHTSSPKALPNTATTGQQAAAQVGSKDVIGWIISSISGIAAAAALVYTAKTFTKDADSKIIEGITKLTTEMKALERDERRARHAQDRLRKQWEMEFVNTVKQIAFLIDKKKYPISFLDYFQYSFQWARFLIERRLPDPEKGDYEVIVRLCNVKGWEAKNQDHD